MTDIDSLRDAIAAKVAACQSRLDSARLEADAAVAAVARIEREFAAVSADARARLDAIQLVEEMLSEAERRTEAFPYRGKIQEDAMQLALRSAGQYLNSAELADALKFGGYEFTSSNPANSTLMAAHANRKKYFVMRKESNRTLIGLVEWGENPEPEPLWVGERDDRDSLAEMTTATTERID